jgi:hypothetical protein
MFSSRWKYNLTCPPKAFDPSLIAGQWQGWWIYRIVRLLGMLAGILCRSFPGRRIGLAKIRPFEVTNAVSLK